MWCTLWYLPLFILPFPQASPFFLLMFLFSLTLQAKPCLYCVIMLFALAQSSCYWQPVPVSDLYNSILSDSLSSPSPPPPSSSQLSEINISLASPSSGYVSLSPTSITYSPPHSPSTTSIPIPTDGTVRLIDRCWCDLSFGLSGTGSPGFFAPFDVRKWELRSLGREGRRRQRELKRIEDAKEEEERRKREEEVSKSVDDSEEKKGDGEDEKFEAKLAVGQSISESDSQNDTAAESNSTIAGEENKKPFTTWFKAMRGSLWNTPAIPLASTNETDSNVPTDEVVAVEESPEVDMEQEQEQEKVAEVVKPVVPLPPHTIDLRPYGIGLVIDYGWSRSSNF